MVNTRETELFIEKFSKIFKVVTTQCRSFAYSIPNSLVLFCRFFDANNDRCFVISRSMHQWLDNPYLVKLTFDSHNVNALTFQIFVF